MGWTYSDTNYIVLGMILERIIGTTYYSELQKRLLGPLRLEHTVPAVKPVIPGLSQGYLGTGADNPFGFGDAILVNGRLILSPQWEWTGGGIASTSEDMARQTSVRPSWGDMISDSCAGPARQTKFGNFGEVALVAPGDGRRYTAAAIACPGDAISSSLVLRARMRGRPWRSMPGVRRGDIAGRVPQQ
jgi:hypothetical protein